MDLELVLKEATRRIVQHCQPDKIILFGSHASGRAGDDSDIDLMVITSAGASKRQQAVALYRLLRDLGIAKDILVVRPDEFERSRNLIGTVIYPAAHGGRILYDCAA